MKPIALIILIALAITGCNDKEENNVLNVDSYPLNNGTEWIYQRQLLMKKYESATSDKIIDIDTSVFNLRVWIEKDTVLCDTMAVKVFKTQESGHDWVSTQSIQYMFLDEEGLKSYAYSSSGSACAFAQQSSYLKSLIGCAEPVGDDPIHFETKPTLAVKLPLAINSTWTYRHPTDNNALQIDKTVTGAESVNLIGQDFNCFKVEWKYMNDSLYNGLKVTDWISEKGLIKSITVYNRFTISTEDEEPTISGNVQMVEILTLKQLKIQ